MSIFLSQRPNLDPHPWVDDAGRYSTENAYWTGLPRRFDPRPKFEPTRDPEPMVSDAGVRFAIGAEIPGLSGTYMPRRDEYDTPVNPILARFRQDIRERGEHPFWGDTWDSYMDWIDHARATDRACRDQGITDDHINHARKVLQRLANLNAKEG